MPLKTCELGFELLDHILNLPSYFILWLKEYTLKYKQWVARATFERDNAREYRMDWPLQPSPQLGSVHCHFLFLSLNFQLAMFYARFGLLPLFFLSFSFFFQFTQKGLSKHSSHPTRHTNSISPPSHLHHSTRRTGPRILTPSLSPRLPSKHEKSLMRASAVALQPSFQM
jgi:hypothetical protein